MGPFYPRFYFALPKFRFVPRGWNSTILMIFAQNPEPCLQALRGSRGWHRKTPGCHKRGIPLIIVTGENAKAIGKRPLRKTTSLPSLTNAKRHTYNHPFPAFLNRPAVSWRKWTVSLRLCELCQLLEKSGVSARLDGEDRTVEGVNTLESAEAGEITFLANPKYLPAVAVTRASAILARVGVQLPRGLSSIRTPDPYAAVTVAIIHLHGHRSHPTWGISERANIHPSARIGPHANIAPGVAIAADVTIGTNATIYAGCYVGDGATIGDDCVLFPNVVVYDQCVLGHRVTIHAGSVVGEDGLGYAPVGDKWIKIPQVGKTVIGDDVEIGANCAVDRATLGRTEIGPGTKFGNVVVIGHGTKIGPDCLFVGQVGVAGSVTVGKHVTLAGQVGVAGHLTIHDNVRVGAQAGISGDAEAGSEMLGSPAIPADQAKRSLLAVQKLPEWIRRIKDLEREVKELRAKFDGANIP